MKGNTHNESKQHQKKHRAQNQHCKAAQSAFEFGLLRPVRQSFGDAAKAVPRPVALTRAMADPLTIEVPRKQWVGLVPYRWSDSLLGAIGLYEVMLTPMRTTRKMMVLSAG